VPTAFSLLFNEFTSSSPSTSFLYFLKSLKVEVFEGSSVSFVVVEEEEDPF